MHEDKVFMSVTALLICGIDSYCNLTLLVCPCCCFQVEISRSDGVSASIMQLGRSLASTLHEESASSSQRFHRPHGLVGFSKTDMILQQTDKQTESDRRMDRHRQTDTERPTVNLFFGVHLLVQLNSVLSSLVPSLLTGRFSNFSITLYEALLKAVLQEYHNYFSAAN